MRPGRHQQGSSGSERSQATVMVVAMVTLLVVVSAALVELGVHARDRARTESIADLVALAAVGGDDAAAAVAGANGAEISVLRRTGEVVSVSILAGGHRASASAEPDGRLGW